MTLIDSVERANGTLILIRHAKAANDSYKDNPDQYPGPELSEEGIRQARTLHKLLSYWSFEECYYSPFERTRQTARIVFDKSCSSQESFEWRENGHDESDLALKNRIESWCEKHLPNDGTIKAVVTHAGPIKAALEIWAPQLVQNAKLYDHGNIVPEAGIVLMRWKSGQVISSKLLPLSSTNALTLKAFLN